MSVEQLPSFASAARTFWESIPADIRPKLLSNVYCVHCGDEVTITNFNGRVEGGDLILVGKCSVCGEGVARVIEGPDG